MTNFKMHFGIFLILAAVLLSGCQKKNENSQGESSDISSVQSTESSYTSEDSIGFDDSSQGDSSEVTSTWSEPPQHSSSSSENELPEPNHDYSINRVYPDDELVPGNWQHVYSQAEALTKVNEIITADTSGDPESAILALMHKNLLFYDMFNNINANGVIIFDGQVPYYPDGFEHPVYPFKSDYFPDVQSIYDFAYSIYKPSAFEELFFGTDDKPRKLFVEENGISYLNYRELRILAVGFFMPRSYIEITNKTENTCTFVWHFADYEMLNLPEEGYEYHYYERTCTAEYIDGLWKLDKIIFTHEEPNS